MKRLLVLAALSAALMTSACVTVIDATDDDDHLAWHSEGGQSFDDARDACRASTGKGQRSDDFRDCMAGRGWTRS